MHVMLHHQKARIALVVFLSVPLLTTGCRSTRNGLSGLPGMGWVAADDGGIPSWGSDSDDSGLPPPSTEATPQTTDAQASKDGYPDTGFPSPYGKDGKVVRSGGSYPTGHFDKSRAINPAETESLEAATVGNTQKGFYGEDYADESQDVAGNEPSSRDDYRGDYDGYSDAYTSEDYPSNSPRTSDADPRFEQLGSADNDSALDPYERDAQGDLEMPDESNGYEKFSQDVRDQIRGGAEAIADGAERVGDRVQDFARDQGDSIRSTVRDGYDRVVPPTNDLGDDLANDSQGYADDAAYPADNGGVGQDDYSTDPYSGYPDTTADASNDYPSDSYDQGTDPSMGSPGQDPSASLNPPMTDGYDRSTDAPGSDQGSPRRTVQPWRPGSTGALRSGDMDQSGRPYPGASAVAPASFPAQATEALRADSRASDYPDHGWQSHPGDQAQRLSPAHR